MRSNHIENIRFQAEKHGIVPTGKFRTIEEKNLYLIHLKAYYEAIKFINGKKVLDLGCNHGYGLKEIRPHCSKVVPTLPISHFQILVSIHRMIFSIGITIFNKL